jgi:hypothetical protein
LNLNLNRRRAAGLVDVVGRSARAVHHRRETVLAQLDVADVPLLEALAGPVERIGIEVTRGSEVDVLCAGAAAESEGDRRD